MNPLEELLRVPLPPEGGEIVLQGRTYVMKDGILRSRAQYGEAQAQTQSTYAYLWSKMQKERESRDFLATWYEEVFPGLSARLSELAPHRSRLLDAGCGAGWSALAFFGEHLREVQYVGVDISDALEHAHENLEARGVRGGFLQESLTLLPLPPASFDFIFTPGVLHHTDSVSASLASLATLLAPGGRLLLWVYSKQPPLREFADALIRGHLAGRGDDAAYQELLPLTRLGEALGRLNVDLDVPDDIPVLGIPKGKMNLQRFFNYYVVKAFYNEAVPLETANLHNFDWYRPLNSHTSTMEEIEAYCAAAGLTVEWKFRPRSGLSVLARKPPA